MLVESLLRFMLVSGSEWVLWLLLGLSLLSIGATIERAFVFFSNTIDVDAIAGKLDSLLAAGDRAGAARLLDEHPAVETRCARAGLDKLDAGSEAMEETLAARIDRERQRLERNLTFLGTLGNNAPFIGLFGTVLGIVKAFHDLSQNTQQGAAAVMSGISEALVATAVGLFVAIPAVVAYNFFNRRVKRVVNQSNYLGRILLAHAKDVSARSGATQPARRDSAAA